MPSLTTPYIPYLLDDRVTLVINSGRGIGAKVVVNYTHSEALTLNVVTNIKELGSDAVAPRADVRNVAKTTKLMDEAVARF